MANKIVQLQNKDGDNIYPIAAGVTQTIHYGTTAPASSLGEDGDMYVQYGA